MLKYLLKNRQVKLLLMLKVGGVNSPQFQLHTSFVYGQQIDIDAD